MCRCEVETDQWQTIPRPDAPVAGPRSSRAQLLAIVKPSSGDLCACPRNPLLRDSKRCAVAVLSPADPGPAGRSSSWLASDRLAAARSQLLDLWTFLGFCSGSGVDDRERWCAAGAQSRPMQGVTSGRWNPEISEGPAGGAPPVQGW